MMHSIFMRLQMHSIVADPAAFITWHLVCGGIEVMLCHSVVLEHYRRPEPLVLAVVLGTLHQRLLGCCALRITSNYSSVCLCTVIFSF